MPLLEQALLSGPTYLGEAWLSVRFMQSFLIQKRGGRSFRLIWTVVCFAPMMLLFLLVDNMHPLAGVLWVAVRLIPLLILQQIFFRFDCKKLLFLIISFLSGIYLLRYLITTFYIMAMDGVFALFYRWSEYLDLSTGLAAEKQVTFWKNTMHLAQAGVMLLVTVSYVLLLWWYLRLLKNSFTRKDLPLTKRETILLILPCLTAVTASFFIRMTIAPEGDLPNLFYRNLWSRFLIPLVSILLLASIIAAAKLLQAEFQYREAAKQQMMLDAQIRQMRTEIDGMQQTQEQMRAFKHDLRGHLSNIASYVRRMESEYAAAGKETERDTNKARTDRKDTAYDAAGLTKYLTQMEQTIDEVSLGIQTGHPVTDIILNRWSTEAKKRDVSLETAFRFAEEEIDAYDMAVILNNALENALTAADRSKQAGGKGFVHLRSRKNEALYFVEIENDYTGDIVLDKVTELPRTTYDAPDGAEHGLGLQNIKRCAESYLGAMDVALTEEDGNRIFHLTVMLNTAPRSFT